jgi:hypothetical protein
LRSRCFRGFGDLGILAKKLAFYYCYYRSFLKLQHPFYSSLFSLIVNCSFFHIDLTNYHEPYLCTQMVDKLTKRSCNFTSGSKKTTLRLAAVSTGNQSQGWASSVSFTAEVTAIYSFSKLPISLFLRLFWALEMAQISEALSGIKPCANYQKNLGHLTFWAYTHPSQKFQNQSQILHIGILTSTALAPARNFFIFLGSDRYSFCPICQNSSLLIWWTLSSMYHQKPVFCIF